MKKTTWIKIAQLSVTTIPPVAVLCCYFPHFIKTTGTTISAAGLLVIIILACILKDQTKKWFSTPSAFKICVVIFVLSVIAVNLGQEMLIISATGLASGACGVPFDMWYKHETAPTTNDEMIDALKDFIKENKNEESVSDENN